MAIDSALKRRAASGIQTTAVPGVTPDATSPEAWRWTAGWGYLVVAAPPVADPEVLDAQVWHSDDPGAQRWTASDPAAQTWESDDPTRQLWDTIVPDAQEWESDDPDPQNWEGH